MNYTPDDIEAAVAKALEGNNAAWRLMCEQMVAAERDRCAKLCDVSAAVAWGAHAEYADASDTGAAIAAEQLARAIRKA